METDTGLPKPFGRYVLLNKLAVGGMAEIYKAKTYGVDGFEKQLVIKRILTNYSSDKEFIHMLIDEAKLTVLLSHANLVQVFDLGKVGDDYFISMEYINGTNLREMVSRVATSGEKFSEDIAVYIMSEVCKGLDYAHRKTDGEGNPLHIVHRDISPQNILISYEGEVKIVDFGIAKAKMNISHTSAGILKGKIAYMSPEQALGKPIDHRTDIFSAGLVLYEMLTGQKLFTGETQFEVLNQIRTRKITKENLPETIAPQLRGILAKALAFSIKDRYQSAADFQLDLTKYLYSSYLDFSPRQLSALLHRLFENEIKRKDPTFSLSEKTKSVLVRQSKLEDIVVHGPPSRSITEMESGPDTSASGFFEETKEQRSITPFLWIGGGALVVLLAIFLFLVWRSPNRQEPRAPVIEHKQAPVEEPEEFGTLNITSTPPGAEVFLNNQDTGLVTPTKIGNLTLGEEYQLKLSLKNYRDFTKTVAVTTQDPIIIEAPLNLLAPVNIAPPQVPPPIVTPSPTPVAPPPVLTPAPAIIPTPSTPPVTGAIPAPTTPPPPPATTTPPKQVKSKEELKPQKKVEKPESGKEKKPKEIEKKVEKPQEAAPPSPPTPPEEPKSKAVTGNPLGDLVIATRPPRAMIYLDGVSLGTTTPITIGNVPRNRVHRIKLVLDGYKSWQGTIDLSSDNKKTVNVTLEKE